MILVASGFSFLAMAPPMGGGPLSPVAAGGDLPGAAGPPRAGAPRPPRGRGRLPPVLLFRTISGGLKIGPQHKQKTTGEQGKGCRRG